MKKVGIVIFLLLAAFIVTGYLLPKQVHIERSITVDRPANIMFEILNSYRYFNDWSPWVKRDPNADLFPVLRQALVPESVGSVTRNWSVVAGRKLLPVTRISRSKSSWILTPRA